MADHLGRRRMLTGGLTGFTLASAACAFAPTAGWLVVLRVIQGAAAAVISPAVLSIIGVSYHGPDRARALSVYGIVMGLAAAGGQIIGGALVNADVGGLGWRAIFLINLPLGLLAVVMSPRLLKESRAERGRPLDGTGMALITAALTALVLPLIEGRVHGWPWWSWLSFVAGGVLVMASGGSSVRSLKPGERRSSTPSCSGRAPSSPVSPRSSSTGVPRPPDTSSSPSTCRTDVASTRSTPGSPSPFWLVRTS
jgi:MFS family permease